MAENNDALNLVEGERVYVIGEFHWRELENVFINSCILNRTSQFRLVVCQKASDRREGLGSVSVPNGRCPLHTLRSEEIEREDRQASCF